MKRFPLSSSLLRLVRLAREEVGTDSSRLLLRSRLVRRLRLVKDRADGWEREHWERLRCWREGRMLGWLKLVRLLPDRSRDLIFSHLLTASVGTSSSWKIIVKEIKLRTQLHLQMSQELFSVSVG